MKRSNYIDHNKENNKEDSQFNVGDHVRISKYKSSFAKGYAPNWSKVLKKVKNIASWTYTISDLDGEKSVGTLYKKELQKTNQTEFKVEKVIKGKSIKLYVEWKGYNN